MISVVSSPFRSFFQGGFECSTHVRKDGRRLDLISATGHDRFALQDYGTLGTLGIWTVRDGLRWHLIEKYAGHYDFSSFIPMLRAASIAGSQVIWDLFHYGWPCDLDIYSPAFVRRFGRFARAVACLLRDETPGHALITPVNEPSFVSWCGGDTGHINPFSRGQGFELKQQLVRAAIEATEAVWDVLPHARICQAEPAIHIVADPRKPNERQEAERYRLFQFQALDMLSGAQCPELGGNPRYLDIIGINYYFNNQWIHQGRTLYRHDPLYRPFRSLVEEFYLRYQKPLYISETGTESIGRPRWLRYIATETAAAIESGIPVHGICLYPIVNHPGWDNDRPCNCGLLDPTGTDGDRHVHQPLADEIYRWRDRFENIEQYRYATNEN